MFGCIPASMHSGISKLVALLHRRNVPVYLISGGFGCIIEPVATALDIPCENVFANELLFYFNGQFIQ
jgi:phosphoserine phosphatase